MLKLLRKTIFLLLFISLGLTMEACVYEDEPTSENSRYTINIRNYLNNFENIHPKVLYFDNTWGGYFYWMAYTPYPLGSTDDENPCIAVSQDGINWTTPKGLKNPLAGTPPTGYNSDTHLVYDAKNDRLECWWREYDRTDKSDLICRRVSANGVDWSEKEIMIPGDASKGMRMSPTVWIKDGKYKLVYSNGSKLYLTTTEASKPGENWSDPVEVPVDWGELRAWHQDLILDENGDWEMIVCAYTPGNNNNSADLYYVKVASDFSWSTDPVLILRRSENPDDFDHRSIYRSSIVKIKDIYWVYYSAIDEKWSRHMSLLKGPSILELQGLRDEDCDVNYLQIP